MKSDLSKEHAIMHACTTGLLLIGFTVADDHSSVLCERGYEYYYGGRHERRLRTREERDREMLERVR